MEYRKLIAFGKSSFVISLPRDWIRRNKLKKGDLIYLDENSSNLLLQPRPAETEQEEKEITITVDKKSVRQIQREIVSAYIRNFKTVNLIGEEIKLKLKDIQDIVQNLVALEIMEQTSQKIVAKDFLNMKETDVKSLIKKMDITVRSMLGDCKLLFKESVYENILHRDHDVNKLSFLLYRAIRYGIDNPSIVLKKYQLSANDFLSFWWVTYNIEAIGDDTKRIARYAMRMQFTEEMKTSFIRILADLERDYVQIMNSLYKNDSSVAHAVHERKHENIKKCEEFYEKHNKVTWSGYLVTHLKSLTTNINNIGRSIYQY